MTCNAFTQDHITCSSQNDCEIRLWQESTSLDTTTAVPTVMRGFWGWTVAKYEMIVDSYEIGPPSGNLFTIPAEYKQAPWRDLTEPFDFAR
jgi:hypothetical protein